MRFVIARIDKGGAVGLKPVAQGERRMIEVAAGNLGVPKSALPRRARDSELWRRGAQGLRARGKIAYSQSLPQALVEAARPVDVSLNPGNEKWREKWDTLNVVPVGVADQNMTA